MVPAEIRKEIALLFLQLVIAGKIDEAFNTCIGPGFVHHNPFFPGDAKSLARGMRENEAEFPGKILGIKHVLEQGDLVAVHSHLLLKPGKTEYAAVHLFRFEQDHIVELWDLVQSVPSGSPNKNSMF